MPENLAQLLVQVGLSGVFLWLYFDERRQHNITRAEVRALQDARLKDTAETRDKVTTTLSGISQTLDQINTKIVVSKQNENEN
jgi:hypothetical protein